MKRILPGIVVLLMVALLSVAARRVGAQATENANTAVRAAAQGESTGAIAEAAHESAKGEEGGSIIDIKPGELIATIAIFVMLVIVLRFTAWKPILAGLKTREQAIRDGIEAAAKAREDAARATRDLEAKMAEAQRQGAQALIQAKADAVKLADSIRSQAEAESTALKDRALRDIDAAKQQAVAEINAHAASLATSIARKILQRNVTVEDQARLVEESLTQLQASKN